MHVLDNIIQNTDWVRVLSHHYFHITTQAGVTNPLSDTFRIYNPNKNIEDRDADLQFIYYWVPELRGYSLLEILAKAYMNESPYPNPILDWSQTRKANGKIISDVRKRAKQRLLLEQGEEYEKAVVAKKTVDKYWEVKDKQYQQYKREELLVSIKGPTKI